MSSIDAISATTQLASDNLNVNSFESALETASQNISAQNPVDTAMNPISDFMSKADVSIGNNIASPPVANTGNAQFDAVLNATQSSAIYAGTIAALGTVAGNIGKSVNSLLKS